MNEQIPLTVEGQKPPTIDKQRPPVPIGAIIIGVCCLFLFIISIFDGYDRYMWIQHYQPKNTQFVNNVGSMLITSVLGLIGLIVALGIFLRKRWVWPISVICLVALIIGDVLFGIFVDGRVLRGLVIFLPVLAYFFTPKVKTYFEVNEIKLPQFLSGA